MSTAALETFPTLDKACETLLRAAILAPSGDNMQPWRFAVDSSSRRIAIYLDETRDPSPMNSGQRASRLAIGAAMENIVRAAESLAWTIEFDDPRDDALAVIRIVRCDESPREILPAIAKRCTNRRIYDGRPLPEAMAADLARAVAAEPGVKTIWIHDRERVLALAELFARSDALMLSEPSMRRAFLDNVRFDAPWDAVVDEGLSLASLEVSRGDRLALGIMRYLPNWLMRIGGASRKFAAVAHRLVASSSGLCIVTETDGTVRSELLAGRVLQRAWLALAERGLAAQPVMSAAILDNFLALRRASPELIASLGRQQATEVVAAVRRLVPEIGAANLAFLMRFGYAPTPTVRTGRLKLDENTSETGL